jgi:hypothetical protein
MSAQNLFLTVFLGSKDGSAMQAWNQLDEAERQARQQQGMAAWEAWVEKHKDAIVELGGPLGKTKTASNHGIADNVNAMTAFSVVRAESHDEAARMFEDHAHFTFFPGETIDIMPILPIPGR